MTVQFPGVHVVEEAFWIVLGREAGAVELRDELRAFDSGRTDAFVGRLLSSPEFRVMATAWKEGRETGRVSAVQEHGLRTIAFPAISTGIYGYPIEAAAHVAISTVQDFVRTPTSIRKVVFCCFSERDSELYRKLLAPGGDTLR